MRGQTDNKGFSNWFGIAYYNNFVSDTTDKRFYNETSYDKASGAINLAGVNFYNKEYYSITFTRKDFEWMYFYEADGSEVNNMKRLETRKAPEWISVKTSGEWRGFFPFWINHNCYPSFDATTSNGYLTVEINDEITIRLSIRSFIDKECIESFFLQQGLD